MASYYFLTTLLPELQLGCQPELKFAELDRLMKENLTAKDYALTKIIRELYDIENMRSAWLGVEHDHYGNMNEQQLDEALLYPDNLPPYMTHYLEEYPIKEQRLSHFSKLLAAYLRSLPATRTPFVLKYLEFERQLRLIQTAYRARGLKRELFVELQFENPDESFIAELLAQADAKNFVPPTGYEPLMAIFEAHGNTPLALYHALLEYRFQRIDSFVEPAPFSVDSILAYMVKLIALEKALKLDRQKGISIIDRYVKDQT